MLEGAWATASHSRAAAGGTLPPLPLLLTCVNVVQGCCHREVLPSAAVTCVAAARAGPHGGVQQAGSRRQGASRRQPQLPCCPERPHGAAGWAGQGHVRLQPTPGEHWPASLPLRRSDAAISLQAVDDCCGLAHCLLQLVAGPPPWHNLLDQESPQAVHSRERPHRPLEKPEMEARLAEAVH